MTPRLIVTGDDFGRTESLTRGVIEAHERGILTSASLVASSQCFDLAVELANQHPKLSVGVHLVVNEYSPVSSPGAIPSLVRSDGRFYPRAGALLRMLSGRARRDEIRREWEGQIRRVQEAGIAVSHLDGHGHCHVIPPLAHLVAKLCADLAVPAVRLPAEPLAYLGASGRFSVRRHAEKLLLRGACSSVGARWKQCLRFSDAFFGFMDGGRLNLQSLGTTAMALPPGVSELMAHPSLSNDDAPYQLAYDWRGDFEALVAYSKASFEERFGVELVSYREAWS